MQIEVANQRMLLLKDQITPQQAKEKAWQKKVSAFDALSKVTSFLSRPKDEEFALTYSEHRYEPFWHVIAQARYEYTRKTNYQVAVAGREVKSVTLRDSEYLGKVLQNFLFDVGLDAVGIFVPGGSIAVKAAKRYIDTRIK